MKKSVKISMIVAGCLMGVGLISGLIGMTLIGFDFGNIDDQKFEKRAMVIGKNENINEIDCIMINTINDDIEYKVSEDETLRIEYYASNNITYDIDVLDDLSMNSYEDEEEENEDKTLRWFDNMKSNDEDKTPTGSSYLIWIRQNDERKWYEKIGIQPLSWITHKLTVYLPKEDYTEIYAETISGDMTLNTKLSVSKYMTLQSVSGNVSVQNVNVKDFSANSTSGDIRLKNIKTDKNCGISTTSGDIIVEDISLDGLLNISTISGDINATLPKGLNYNTQTTSGDVHIPMSSQDGKICSLSTVSGDINVEERE